MKDRRGRIELGLLAVLALAVLLAGVVFVARGHPDWQVQTSQLSFVDFDTGELAARVGSPFTYLRRGRVVYLDSFECGLAAWERTLPGTSAVRLSSLAPFHGRRAVELVPSANPADTSVFIKRFPRISGRRAGFEAMIWVEDDLVNTTGIIALRLADFDGTNRNIWNAQIDADNDRLLYRNGLVLASGLGQLGFPSGALGQNLYHHLKVVVDLVARELVEVWFNGILYTPSNKTPEVTAAPNAAHTTADFAVFGDANQQSFFVDAVALTMDDP